MDLLIDSCEKLLQFVPVSVKKYGLDLLRFFTLINSIKDLRYELLHRTPSMNAVFAIPDKTTLSFLLSRSFERHAKSLLTIKNRRDLSKALLIYKKALSRAFPWEQDRSLWESRTRLNMKNCLEFIMRFEEDLSENRLDWSVLGVANDHSAWGRTPIIRVAVQIDRLCGIFLKG